MVVLKKWCQMWINGQLSPNTAELWTAAVISPLDCGETTTDDGHPKPKLRPIGLAEVLLKSAELAGASGHQLELWPHIKQSLERDGHMLRESKC